MTAVVNAYTELYNRQDKSHGAAAYGCVGRPARVAARAHRPVEQGLRDQSKEYGSTKLDTFYDAAVRRVVKLEQALADVSVAIATAGSSHANGAALAASTQPAAAEGQVAGDAQPADRQIDPTTATPEQIASVDPEMRRRLDEQSRRQSEMDQLLASGLLPRTRTWRPRPLRARSGPERCQ